MLFNCVMERDASGILRRPLPSPTDPGPKVLFVLDRPEESGVHQPDGAGTAKPTHTAQTATS